MRFHLFTGSCTAEVAAQRMRDAVPYDPSTKIRDISAGTYGVWFNVNLCPAFATQDAERFTTAVVRFGHLHTSKDWFTNYRHML